MGKNIGFRRWHGTDHRICFCPSGHCSGIGAYFHIFLPQFSVTGIAIAALFYFHGAEYLWSKGSRSSFELLVTFFAVFELLLFAASHCRTSMQPILSAMHFPTASLEYGRPYLSLSGFSSASKVLRTLPKKRSTLKKMF
jgi:hypothetical protein